MKDTPYKVSVEIKSFIVQAVARRNAGWPEKPSKRTESVAELLKVDEAVLVLVDEAEDPEGERALGGAEGPGLQQGEELAELLESQLVLLQIRQAGVMVEQSWTLHRPVAAEEMLPLKRRVIWSLFYVLFFFF